MDDHVSLGCAILGIERSKAELECAPYLSTLSTALTEHANSASIPVLPANFAKGYLEIAALVKQHGHYTRSRFRDNVYVTGSQRSESCAKEIDARLNIVLQAMLMVDCDEQDFFSTSYELGNRRPLKWLDEETLDHFTTRTFQKCNEKELEQLSNIIEDRDVLVGWRLEKESHIRIQGTDNLANHLLFDKQAQVLFVFHYSSYLKAMLRRVTRDMLKLDAIDSLTRGSPPPQLLLEVLRSFQYILFPTNQDSEAWRQLQKLVQSKQTAFDPSGLTPEEPVGHVPPGFQYEYLANRLITLHEAVRKPPARGPIMKWVEKHNTERNALYVAILGLFLSVLFGFIGVIIGAVQTWISYKAWKYPVSSA